MNPANESSKRKDNYPIHVSTELCLGIGSSQKTQNNSAKTNTGYPDFPKKRLAKRWREENAQQQEAEERAANRLKEKEKQLMTEILSENEMLRKRVSELEEKVDELMEEEGESSACVDLTRLQPLTLECTVCWRRRAAVMLYPCRNFCVCQVCGLYIRTCPVCKVFKEASFNIKLPNMHCLNWREDSNCFLKLSFSNSSHILKNHIHLRK